MVLNCKGLLRLMRYWLEEKTSGKRGRVAEGKSLIAVAVEVKSRGLLFLRLIEQGVKIHPISYEKIINQKTGDDRIPHIN